MQNEKINIKEIIIGSAGSVSGAASILGSWQVCHNVCLGIVALLGIIGITVAGMPLFFLTKLAVPFWIAAIVLFAITLIFYFTKKCISENLILLNSGLLIAGIPFQSLQNFSILFWIVGGALCTVAILFYINEKSQK